MRIEPVQISFKNELKIKNSNSYGVIAGAAAAGTAGAILLGGKLSVKSFLKALQKQGVELKNGIAYVKSTGEKYTGTVKRHIGTFGYKTETTKFEEGIVTEKLYHNIFGKELEGEFYKSGILRLKVGEGKNYSMVSFDSNGKCISLADCRAQIGTSKFDSARTIVSGIKE